MEAYKKIYIFIACIVGAVILGLGVSLLSLHFNPKPSQYIQISFLQQNLKKGYKVIAIVDNETYKVGNPEELKTILEFSSWEWIDEEQVRDDPWFVLEIQNKYRYTFYPDGYIHAYTSVTEDAFFEVVDETQYQIPAELTEDILDYIISGGGILVNDTDPTAEEQCLENLVPFLGISFADSIQVLSWKKTTWGEYRARFNSAEIFGYEDDDYVLIADVEYSGEKGQTLAAIVVFSAKSCTPIEMQPKDGAQESDPENTPSASG